LACWCWFGIDPSQFFRFDSF